MQPYVFRQEDRPKFNFTFASALGVVLVLLLFLLVQEHNPFQLKAAEIERLQALKEEQQREMVFRFSDEPDEDIEHDAKFLSDADRRQRSMEQEKAPNEDPDPYSKGDTFELKKGQPGPQANATPQPPSPQVVQPEVQAAPELNPEDQQAKDDTKAKPEEKPEEAKEEVADATKDEPEAVKDQEVAEQVTEKMETSDKGTLPVLPGAPRPYRAVSRSELASARQAAMREMNLRDAARVDSGSSASPSFENPTGTNSAFIGLTVETTRSDMGEYLKILRQLIRSNWRIPNIARYEASGVSGISFNIHTDGSITDVYVLHESGHEPLDVSAKNAINNTNPAPPLPKHVDEPFVPIKFGFYYNVRPNY